MQIWGIVAGAFLISFIGSNALVGAIAAILSGLMTYYLYGKKHATFNQTPIQTFRKSFKNPTQYEHERRLTAFRAADRGGRNQLNLREFQNALRALGFVYTSDESRVILDEAGKDENGVMGIVELVIAVE